MYTNVSHELAAAKRRDMLAQGDKACLARRARQLTAASRPPASHPNPRGFRLVRLLHPQAQS
jgi:hypothetical protein